MGYELFVGLRYLKAKRKQSFISVISFISMAGIMVGVTALIIVLSVMNGFEEDLKEKILGINADMVVTEFGQGMLGYSDIASEIRKVEGVEGASPFIYGQAMVSNEGSVMGVVVRGVELDTVGEVSILPDRMYRGTLDGLESTFTEGASGKAGRASIIIGKELARNLGVEVGGELNVISPLGTMTPAGMMPRMASFLVTGIFEVGMYEYDSSMVFVSIENAQKFFRLGDTVSGIEVKVDDIYKVDSLRERVSLHLGGPYWIRTWQDMNKNLFSALKLEKVAMFIILALIVVVAALNIISTLIMVVMEKNKEIAILKSMGATSSSIMKIFIVEGVVIGVIGTILGTITGVLGAAYLESLVVIIERAFDFKLLPPSIYYIDRLPSKIEPSVVAVIAFVSICISFLATIYPSWQASKLNPVEGLRYE